MLIACYAVGCAQAFLYVRGEMALAQERIAAALNEAYAAGYVGRNILGTDFSVDVVLTWGAGAYIVGEETALIESLEGNRGMPRLKPPYFPAAIGLYQQPTIVNNVETLANLPWIMRNGGAAFAELGAETSRGMRMFAVSGHVNKPGVYEVEFGVTTFRDLIYSPVYCGGIRNGRSLKAFIPGGASSPWFFEEHLDLPLEAGAVGKAGSMLGSGAIVVMDDDDRRGARRATGSCASSPGSRAGSARRAARAPSWLEKILARIIVGQGRPERRRHAARRLRQHQPVDHLAAAARPRSARSGRRRCRRSRPRSSASATSSSATSAARWRSPCRSRAPRTSRRRSRRMPDAARSSTSRVTVDGRTIDAAKGQLVIDAAEQHGVYIPRFCYHPRMQPVGMCRMCIVDIDTGRGPALQPACMIPVADGMVVDTKAPGVKKAQDGVLEFLLINHPLDCPVCDKGGECPLQDQAYAYGPGESRFVEEKRHFEKPIPISGLVFLDRERCILCDRCTRFADEVAGDPLIHFMGRGAQSEVNTFPDHPFASYFSGNTVQICPVGALTAKPYRFRARPWDLDKVESTCTSCAVGCRVDDRVVPQPACSATRASTSTRSTGAGCATSGRFDFEYVNHDDRLGRAAGRQGRRARRRRRGARRSAPRPTAIKAALDGPARRHRRARRRPPHERGRLRVGEAGQGRDRHRQRRRPTRRRPSGRRRRSACRGRRSTTSARRAAPCVLLAADIKEELPVLFLRLRDAVVNRGVKVHRAEPRRHRLHAATRPRPSRYRPGEAAEVRRGRCWASATAPRSKARWPTRRACCARASRCRSSSAGRRPPSRPTAIVDAAAAILGHLPGSRSCPRCGGATSTARSTWGWRPACCPAG